MKVDRGLGLGRQRVRAKGARTTRSLRRKGRFVILHLPRCFMMALTPCHRPDPMPLCAIAPLQGRAGQGTAVQCWRGLERAASSDIGGRLFNLRELVAHARVIVHYLRGHACMREGACDGRRQGAAWRAQHGGMGLAWGEQHGGSSMEGAAWRVYREECALVPEEGLSGPYWGPCLAWPEGRWG